MAFANPLVITHNAGTKSLPRVNQDNYGAEYYLREATQEFRAKIRHTREKATATGRVDRHNVEITQTVFGTSGAPDVTRQAYLIYRHDYRDDMTAAAYIGEGLSDLMVEARYSDLSAWLS